MGDEGYALIYSRLGMEMYDPTTLESAVELKSGW